MTTLSRGNHLPGLAVITLLSLFASACSNDTHQAEYTVPESELNVAVSVKNTDKPDAPPQRIIQARDGNKELFSATMEQPKNGSVRARLYKQQEQEYVVVDGNGDRYQLNFRDKRFEKTNNADADTSGKYVGKFDYDKQNSWSFIPGKARKQNGEAASDNTVASNSNGKRSFGPPSKNF